MHILSGSHDLGNCIFNQTWIICTFWGRDGGGGLNPLNSNDWGRRSKYFSLYRLKRNRSFFSHAHVFVQDQLRYYN